MGSFRQQFLDFRRQSSYNTGHTCYEQIEPYNFSLEDGHFNFMFPLFFCLPFALLLLNLITGYMRIHLTELLMYSNVSEPRLHGIAKIKSKCTMY